MERIALFMFHKDWDVCSSRLDLLRAFNPEVQIYGLFGGEAADFDQVNARFREQLSGIYHFRHDDSRWKWQNTDLAVREWFCNFGRELQFQVVHVIQWDLLLFERLARLYRRVPSGALGLTGITPVSSISHRWEWCLAEQLKAPMTQLEAHVRETYGFTGILEASLGPGYCLPRAFLQKYAEMDIPDLGHDEVRLPLYARVLGFPIVDTGFYSRWFDAAEEQYFNANSVEIRDEVIIQELMRFRGRRVFHPYRKVVGPIATAMLPQAVAPWHDRIRSALNNLSCALNHLIRR